MKKTKKQNPKNPKPNPPKTIPFTCLGGGAQLKSQAVKRRVKQFCPKRLLTLTGSSFHKLYHREREKEKKNPNFGGFI